jgi:hypothetical protein
MRLIVTSLLLVIAASTVASAQTLPAPSRTVYKCNVSGKMTYSDAVPQDFLNQSAVCPILLKAAFK